MNDIKEQLLRLINKDELSAGEKEWLLNYIENSDQHELTELLKAEFEHDINNLKPLNPFLSQRILNDIHAKIDQQKTGQVSIVAIWAKRLIAAAAVIAVCSYGVYFYSHQQNKEAIVAKNQPGHHVFKNDIGPGKERAVLSLADGSKIMLDEVKNGTIINQGSSKVIKTNDRLAYNVVGHTDTIAYNTLFTPRAGRYRLELADGTHVWLNAASSIRYPTAFAGKERRVEITGEAYFEVAKNKAMPFIVKVNNSEVRVYGTHFNVMAYNDEANQAVCLSRASNLN